jgi:hypothetical protein
VSTTSQFVKKEGTNCGLKDLMYSKKKTLAPRWWEHKGRLQNQKRAWGSRRVHTIYKPFARKTVQLEADAGYICAHLWHEFTKRKGEQNPTTEDTLVFRGLEWSLGLEMSQRSSMSTSFTKQTCLPFISLPASCHT